MNTHNTFQPPRTLRTEVMTEVMRRRSDNSSKELIFFIEKINDFRRILEQQFGSRSRVTGLNTHNNFQPPRTLRTYVMIPEESEWD